MKFSSPLLTIPSILVTLFNSACSQGDSPSNQNGGTSGDLGSGGALSGAGGGSASGGGSMQGGSGGANLGGGTGGSAFGGSGAGGSGAGGDAGTVGSGGATGSGGEGFGSGGSGGGGDEGGFPEDRATFLLGEASRCENSPFAVCEDFESTNPGELPGGWTLTGYGNRTAQVSEAQSARGARSLEVSIDGGQTAVVGMLQLPSLGQLASRHFGRMFYRMEGPGVSEFVHFDVLAARGPWMGHENEVRLASTGTGVGTMSSNWSWIYNVQPSGDGAGSEFGSEGDRSAHPLVDEWMCLEWLFDSDMQTATYFHDNQVIDYLVIDDERSEVPVLTSVAVGLQKFQQTGAMKSWVDEVALDDERIGCHR